MAVLAYCLCKMANNCNGNIFKGQDVMNCKTGLGWLMGQLERSFDLIGQAQIWSEDWVKGF